MVGAPEAADAVARAHSLPSLRVGLHLVLVEGRPVLPARELPDLTDARGCFRTGLVKLGVDIFVRPRVRRQVAAEIKAQFNAYQATGLPLDHVDVHKHLHLHPTIAGLLFDIGAGYGLRAVRVPAEPQALLARAEPHARYRSLLLAPCAALLKARARRQCVRTADRVFGIAWSGAMTEPRMRALLQSLPEGVTEIYVHPATAGGFNGAASGYRYADELAALTAPAVRAAAHASGAQLGGFIDFASI
jgi:hopanoid biosynthesis associated protein HpnK